MTPSCSSLLPLCFFFFNDTATTEIYTLSLHDALPISGAVLVETIANPTFRVTNVPAVASVCAQDRKSTRLNSSHPSISYAVFCLKKKTNPPSLFFFRHKKKKNKPSY